MGSFVFSCDSIRSSCATGTGPSRSPKWKRSTKSRWIVVRVRITVNKLLLRRQPQVVYSEFVASHCRRVGADDFQRQPMFAGVERSGAERQSAGRNHIRKIVEVDGLAQRRL